MPKRFLDGFAGYLQTDGYEGYHAAVAIHGLVHVGCLGARPAHVR